MDKKQICKICNKRFANGKAMGGHMRSHLAKLPLPPKPNTPPAQQKQQSPATNKYSYSQKPYSSSSSYSSSLNYSTSSGGNPSMAYHKSISHPVNLANTSISTATTTTDGESEAESPRNPTRRRSKRWRKSMEKDSLERVSSSVTDTLTEVDAANCLLMLSSSSKSTKGKQIMVDEEQGVDADKFKDNDDDAEEEEDEGQEEEDEDESYCLTVSKSHHPGKYRCETCNKSFRSYQALGGHRASHKKVKPIKIKTVNIKEENKFDDRSSASGEGVIDHHQRIFSCSFCGKEFESGQALGGHKKVHFPYLGNNPIANPISAAAAGPSGVENFIDLNFPPPEDDNLID